MRGTLFDPAFGGLSGRYPTDQRIVPFEARWSPQEWTRVLEPVQFKLVLPQLVLELTSVHWRCEVP
jgi:hypothetical protein